MSGNRRLDEREMKILSEAMAASIIVAFIYEIIIIIYKLMKTGSFNNVITEVSILGVMVFGTIAYYIATSEYIGKGEGRERQKRSRSLILDERQRKHISESLASGAFFGYFYTLFVIIFKFIRDKAFTNTYLEIILILILHIVLNLHHRKEKEYSLPKTITGRILPMGSSSEEKKSRFKNYVLDSLIISIILIPIDIITKGKLLFISQAFLSYIVSFFFRFVLFLIINYIWGEYNIKRYNNYYYDILDEEEEM